MHHSKARLHAGVLTVLSLVLALLAGCHDAGTEPLAYCSETLSGAGAASCSVDYGACSDNSACDFQVKCAPEGSKTVCHCTAAPNCHVDATFETTELCAANTTPERLRQLVVAGCGLDSDTDFSRVP